MIRYATDVFCDGCSDWNGSAAHTTDKAKIPNQIIMTRTLAGRDGWVIKKDPSDRRKIIDLCPKCQHDNK